MQDAEPEVIDSTKAPEIIILASDQLGFKKNNMTFTLGMDIKKFIDILGEPDEVRAISENEDTNSFYYGFTYHSYFDYGVKVASKENKVSEIVFFMTKDGKFAQSKSITEDGIRTGSSEDDILAKLGSPYVDEGYNILDYRNIFYSHGADTVRYWFDSKKLRKIHLHADFTKILRPKK